jgi:predicted Zn finger-like uncharacterized protein
MIIQCEQCQAKFRLDDSKVTDRGVKVRCAKCKHVFSVARVQSADEGLPTDFPAGRDFQVESTDSSFRTEPTPFEAAASDSIAVQHGDNEFSLSTLEDDKGFDAEPDEAPTEQGADSAFDDIFREVSSPTAEDFLGSASPDFAVDSLSDSMKMDDAKVEDKDSSLAPLSDTDLPFSQGGMELADEPAPVALPQVDPDEVKPDEIILPREILSATSVEAPDKPEPAADDELQKISPPVSVKSAEDDLPPLSITSRRRESPVSSGVIAAVVLLLVGVLGYFGFTSLSEDKAKVVQEVGKISVRAVKASYVKNASAGLLLVISGEAVNEYPKPRAAIQLKGMIFDAKGQILAGKSAFGGNMLTDEQLASLPLDKIEAAMANQFGDSLTNLEVAPGKKVSFMIVIANPSKEGKDFGVEPIGSTVAAGKQQ